jgi:hypothetical protein
MGLIAWTERKVEMNIVEKLVAQLIERTFKNYVTTIIGLLVIVSATLGGAASVISANLALHGVHVQSMLVSIAAIVMGVACILAKDAGVKVPTQVGMILLMIGIGMMCAIPIHGQAADPNNLQNLYAGGLSYSVNASPGIAGTGLYAHLVAGSGTYAFTAVDALPNTLKPFTVTTNIGAGIAQKVTSFGGIGVYVPTALGVSWSGTNTGWQWNGGAAAVIPLKNSYYLMPTVRFLKSSVSGGTGYQPILGVLFGWGK